MRSAGRERAVARNRDQHDGDTKLQSLFCDEPGKESEALACYRIGIGVVERPQERAFNKIFASRVSTREGFEVFRFESWARDELHRSARLDEGG